MNEQYFSIINHHILFYLFEYKRGTKIFETFILNFKAPMIDNYYYLLWKSSCKC